jgi:hypothetical protein
MKNYRMMMMVVLLMVMGRAMADNLAVENVTAQAGELKQIAIVLNNPTHQYAGFQFDLVLPKGIILAKNDKGGFLASLNEDRIDDHTLSVADMGANTYRFLSFSLNNSVYAGAEGILVYATVLIAEDITVGEYNATVRSQILTDADGEEVRWENLSFMFVIQEPSTVTAKSYSRLYGEANPEFEYTIQGGALEGTPEITCEATATSPVGTYDIVISQGSVTNSNVTYVKGTLTITKAPLTIKAGEYTRKQGEENPEFILKYEGFKNNETEEVLTKKPTATCSATKDSEPGEYEVILSGAEAQNYEISYINGKLTVEASAPSVTSGDANGDNVVNAADIVELVNSIMGKPSAKFNKSAADVNGDGVVNAADIVAIVNIIMAA